MVFDRLDHACQAGGAKALTFTLHGGFHFVKTICVNGWKERRLVWRLETIYSIQNPSDVHSDISSRLHGGYGYSRIHWIRRVCLNANAVNRGEWFYHSLGASHRE